MRTTLVTVSTVVVALALAVPASARPNVVLIVTDDQRWDTLEYMPTVQRELVGKGVLFENAFVVNPLCCPSRASILTGTYSHTNGVWANTGPHGGFHVFRDRSTLPVWLDAAGYETMLIGKYLNGYWSPFADATYVPPGWNRWFAYWGPNYYFDYEITDGTTTRRYGSASADYATDVMAAEGARFIRESGPAPFFLLFATKAPHITDHLVSSYSTDPAPRHVNAFAGIPPWVPPSLNEPNVADKPRHIRKLSPLPPARLTELREEQLESLLAVDDAVASLLDALEETGKLADTLIVFTSDNGHAWGEHRWRQKIVPYEESIRVPLVLRYDAPGAPARTESRFALNVDLAPTIAQAGGAAATGFDGRSLFPLLRGTQTTWRRSFLFEHLGTGVPSYCGFRGARWKYVQYRTGEEELYDLRADPYERQSVHRRNALTSSIMSYRGRVRMSECRPPGFRPLRRCTRSGTARADRLVGTVREDWICAGDGDDRIRVGGRHRDVVFCGRGRDRVQADRHDRLKSCEIVTR
jgi:N-acetylglucosamine-6-sulfatase